MQTLHRSRMGQSFYNMKSVEIDCISCTLQYVGVKSSFSLVLVDLK